MHNILCIWKLIKLFFLFCKKTNLKLILKKLKKNKKMVDNVEYIWYIINAPKKKKMQKEIVL